MKKFRKSPPLIQGELVINGEKKLHVEGKSGMFLIRTEKGIESSYLTKTGSDDEMFAFLSSAIGIIMRNQEDPSEVITMLRYALPEAIRVLTEDPSVDLEVRDEMRKILQTMDDMDEVSDDISRYVAEKLESDGREIAPKIVPVDKNKTNKDVH